MYARSGIIIFQGITHTVCAVKSSALAHGTHYKVSASIRACTYTRTAFLAARVLQPAAFLNKKSEIALRPPIKARACEQPRPPTCGSFLCLHIYRVFHTQSQLEFEILRHRTHDQSRARRSFSLFSFFCFCAEIWWRTSGRKESKDRRMVFPWGHLRVCVHYRSVSVYSQANADDPLWIELVGRFDFVGKAAVGPNLHGSSIRSRRTYVRMAMFSTICRALSKCV